MCEALILILNSTQTDMHTHTLKVKANKKNAKKGEIFEFSKKSKAKKS
jgi:hypothetical protein